MSNTVILGAGIVGCSTAYYLSESPRTQAQSIHLVEPSPELFHCASGLAGGFLAADCKHSIRTLCYSANHSLGFAPTVAPLGALSFKLHKELAEKYDGKRKWGYSPSTGTSLSLDSDVVGGSGEDFLRNGTSRAQAAGARPVRDINGPAWLAMAEDASLEIISRENSTAQMYGLAISNPKLPFTHLSTVILYDSLVSYWMNAFHEVYSCTTLPEQFQCPKMLKILSPAYGYALKMVPNLTVSHLLHGKVAF